MVLNQKARHHLALFGFLAVLLVCSLLLASSAQSQNDAPARTAQNFQFLPAVITPPMKVTIKGPFVHKKVEPDILTGGLGGLAAATPVEVAPLLRGGSFITGRTASGAALVDPALQADAALSLDNGKISDPILNFDGIRSGANPHDPVGDVGPDHYIQMINSQFAIFDKTGAILAGPSNINSLWTAAGATGQCAINNNGDPIVLYDEIANRWLMSQFARPNHECIAISRSADPVNGGWYLYEFEVDEFPDYPKLAVWPDAYYMGANFDDASPPVAATFAFDRANMLNGNPAASVHFTVSALPGLGGNVLLPSDLDGANTPPAGSPNYFYRQVDGDDFGGMDRLEIFEFEVNWGNPAASSLTGPTNLNMAGFDSDLCGYFSFSCVPQPGGVVPDLDPVNEWPMWRLQYRNFGTHETMVGNFTVDVDGSDNHGIRWFELRKSGGAWSLYQQGTYAPEYPDATSFEHRWMGSIAMDKAGNIALGYSVSNSTDVFPSIRYAGRLASDPLGLLPHGEVTLIDGETTINSRRWGDYSSMNVDPADGCTFWYTNDYVDSVNGRQTRIGTFRFPSCLSTDLAVTKTDYPDPVTAGEKLWFDITVFNNGGNTATNVVVTDTLPIGVSYDVATADCTFSPGTGMGGEDQLFCDLGDIPGGTQSQFTIQVTVDSDYVAGSGGSGTLKNQVAVAADQEETNTENNTATTMTIVNDLADLRVSKDCKPDEPIDAGQEAICTIVVENLGPSTARSVKAIDKHLSDGTFHFGTVTTTSGICTTTPDPQAGSGTVECDLGDLASGDTVTIVVPEWSDGSHDLNDQVTVSSETPDPDPANNQASDKVIVTALADLSITKTDSPDPVNAGEQLTYMLTIANAGPSTAFNVIVEDVLPAGVSIDSVTPSAGTCLAGVPGNAALPTVCFLGNLADGATETIEIVVTVLPQANGLLQNDAKVDSDTDDPDMSNNSTSTTTTVNASADLSIVKTDSPDPVFAGERLVYELLITNHGPSTAYDVEVVDTLPVEVTFMGYTVSNGSGTCVLLGIPPNSVTCDLNDLNPGEFVRVFIDTLVDIGVPDGQVITNTATVSSKVPDPDLSNNTSMASTTVMTQADLEIFKEGDVDITNPSWTVKYTIDVVNHGASDAQNVVVVDDLPLDPKKVVYVFDTGNGACNYDIGLHRVTCNFGTLAAGDSLSVEIYVDVRGSVGTIMNIATVSASTFDKDLTNNTARKDLYIHG